MALQSHMDLKSKTVRTLLYLLIGTFVPEFQSTQRCRHMSFECSSFVKSSQDFIFVCLSIDHDIDSLKSRRCLCLQMAFCRHGDKWAFWFLKWWFLQDDLVQQNAMQVFLDFVGSTTLKTVCTYQRQQLDGFGNLVQSQHWHRNPDANLADCQKTFTALSKSKSIPSPHPTHCYSFPDTAIFQFCMCAWSKFYFSICSEKFSKPRNIPFGHRVHNHPSEQ